MNRTGPDIICSMDEKNCKKLIISSNEIFQMRGGKKEPALEEKVTIDFAYASVCTINKIKKGEKFSKKNIWVKRPGTGEILADDFESILGRKSASNLENNIQLKRKDII
jgi:sialic acid synthase SpsE